MMEGLGLEVEGGCGGVDDRSSISMSDIDAELDSFEEMI